MPATAKYVYGVVPAAARPPSGTGLRRRRLKTIDARETAAIVSDFADRELQATKEDLLAHNRVLERVLEDGPVLPMRFGVVMPDETAVRERLLEPFRDDLVAQLAALDGKVELHVRATYEQDALMSEVVEGNPGIAARREALRGADPDATYYEQIELGQLVADAVERVRELDTVAILDALEPHADGIDVGTPEHERVAAHVSFLVDQSHVPAFDEAVDELGRRNDGRLRFKYTGPLPPYSFAALPEQG